MTTNQLLFTLMELAADDKYAEIENILDSLYILELFDLCITVNREHESISSKLVDFVNKNTQDAIMTEN